MSKMLCDSNSVSLMSLDNSSSSVVSEPTKKFSPTKFPVKSWWEDVEAAEHTVFQQDDAVNGATQQPFKCIATIDTENKSVTTMDSDMLTLSNKIKVTGENNVVDKDQSNYQFRNRTNESNNSTATNSLGIEINFLDPSNGQKYDRLSREVNVKAPFKRRLSGESRSNSPISFFSTQNECADERAAEASTSNKHSQEESSTTSHSGMSIGRGHNKRRRCNQELETSAEVLARRQKQIEYGKNTIGYDNYIKQIPRNKRSKDHPWTPPKQFKYSRRAFDGLVKVWRTKLHCFDQSNSVGTTDNHADDGSSESDDDGN